jgi:hypothetical protein
LSNVHFATRVIRVALFGVWRNFEPLTRLRVAATNK